MVTINSIQVEQPSVHPMVVDVTVCCFWSAGGADTMTLRPHDEDTIVAEPEQRLGATHSQASEADVLLYM